MASEETVEQATAEKFKDTANFDYEVFLGSIVFVVRKSFVYLMAILTRYYPFSEFFKDKLFHANWIGAERMLEHINLCCYAYNNRYKDAVIDRDENFYYITCKLVKETDEDVFGRINASLEGSGLVVQYRGKQDDGSHKFMALVNQNWLKVFF